MVQRLISGKEVMIEWVELSNCMIRRIDFHTSFSGEKSYFLSSAGFPLVPVQVRKVRIYAQFLLFPVMAKKKKWDHLML